MSLLAFWLLIWIWNLSFQDVHLQGQTIQCLENKLDKVDKDCKAALLRIAELSSDDYHKDRALYFACRGDRERFCDTVAAGEGRVYKCLLLHKKEKEMSDQVQTDD